MIDKAKSFFKYAEEEYRKAESLGFLESASYYRLSAELYCSGILEALDYSSEEINSPLEFISSEILSNDKLSNKEYNLLSKFVDSASVFDRVFPLPGIDTLNFVYLPPEYDEKDEFLVKKAYEMRESVISFLKEHFSNYEELFGDIFS